MAARRPPPQSDAGRPALQPGAPTQSVRQTTSVAADAVVAVAAAGDGEHLDEVEVEDEDEVDDHVDSRLCHLLVDLHFRFLYDAIDEPD